MKQISFWDKPRIKFTEDSTELCESFKKGTEWEMFMEQESNYIINYRGVFYGPFKSKCRKVN